MKYAAVLLLSIFAVAFAVAHEQEWKASFDHWKSVKPSRYSFTAVSQSVVIDLGDETTITVENDVVVGRSFIRRRNGKITTSWSEPADGKINSHSAGFVGINLDTVYSQCRSNILIQNTVGNEIIFLTDSDGLIANCGKSPINCEDDCFRGIIVDNINLSA